MSLKKISTDRLIKAHAMRADPVTVYAIDVLSGHINEETIGYTERLVCRRHLEDLSRMGDEDFPYVYDWDIADEGIIKFITKYCYFTDGELNGHRAYLVDFQAFILGSLFSWVHKDTGFRRFRQAYIQVGRKNTKTYLVSWVANYMCFADGYPGAQVYAAANAKEQAKIAWKNCAKTIRMSKVLSKRARIKESVSEIHYDAKFSIIKALSKDTSNLDGFDPHCGIIDEYHAHRTNQVYKLIDDGAVQQSEALIFIITTAGFNLNYPSYSEYEYCKRILKREVDNDTRFIYIAELDEEDDISIPKNWLKPNPLFRYLPDGLEKLRIKVQEAIDNPKHMRNMLTKTLNMWVDMVEDGYMDVAQWRELAIEPAELLELIKGRECYVGVDLSQKHDLSSAVFEVPLDEQTYAVFTMTFIPEKRVEEKSILDKAPYQEWIDQGWMKTCEGLTIRNKDVEDFIDEFSADHDLVVKEVDYDSYSALQFAQNMDAKGYSCIEIRQGYPTLSEPTKDFRNKVYDGHIIHDGNPVMTWMMGNAIEKADHNGNIKLDKSNRALKIDGPAAAMNAHTRAMHHFDNYGNQLEEVTDEYLDSLGW